RVMRTGFATLTVLSLLTIAAAPLVHAQTTTSHPAAAARTSSAASAPAVDGGWPRGFTTPSGAKLLLYQPPVETWVHPKHLTLYAAASYLSPGANTPALGTLKIESDTRVAVPERLVSFSEFRIAEANFPTLSKDAARSVVAEILAAVPRNERVIALDRVLA